MLPLSLPRSHFTRKNAEMWIRFGPQREDKWAEFGGKRQSWTAFLKLSSNFSCVFHYSFPPSFNLSIVISFSLWSISRCSGKFSYFTIWSRPGFTGKQSRQLRRAKLVADCTRAPNSSYGAHHSTILDHWHVNLNVRYLPAKLNAHNNRQM